jgi:Flp pilus assembly protein TadB
MNSQSNQSDGQAPIRRAFRNVFVGFSICFTVFVAIVGLLTRQIGVAILLACILAAALLLGWRLYKRIWQ